MAMGEQGGDRAVPLAEAAARLGLSRDALRMRIRRGTARGFKRGRLVYVWLEDAAPAVASPGAPPGAPPGAAPRKTGRPVGAAGGAWPAMVALQKEEIARLIQETERLNARLDRHLDEAREMRLMLRREQVLRQQEQSLRRDVQNLLERVISHPAIGGAPASGAPASSALGRSQGLAEMLEEIGQSLRELEARDA